MKKEKRLTELVKRILMQEHHRGFKALQRVGDDIIEELEKVNNDTPCEINDGYIKGLSKALALITASIMAYEDLNKDIIAHYERIMNND